MWQSVYYNELHTTSQIKRKGKKKANKHAKTGEEAVLFWELFKFLAAKRQSLKVVREAIIDSARPHAKQWQAGCIGKWRCLLSPLDPMKYSFFFHCKKVFLKLSACFKLMTGVTQISSLSFLLSKMPVPGLIAQTKI